MASENQSQSLQKVDEVTSSGDAQAPEKGTTARVIRPPPKTSLTFQSAINGKLPKNNHYIFYSHKPTAEGAFLSNFWPSPFKDDEGNEWLTSESYFQACKAIHANDLQTAKKIYLAKTPATAKKLGRAVNLEGVDWDTVSWRYMLDAVFFKFKNNPELRQKLLATGEKIIVEATPDDNVWASGLTPSKTISTEIEKWKGENMLGEVLMFYRKYLQHLESKGLDLARMLVCPNEAEEGDADQQGQLGQVSNKRLSDNDTAATGAANPDDNVAKISEPETYQGKKRKANSSHEVELARKEQAVEEPEATVRVGKSVSRYRQCQETQLAQFDEVVYN